MEKKTIGGFIAALRKANGMTQKELAEKLNVSDKSISRWERDETAPDLTLIPVIAEIFDITSDELLKGERNKPNDEAPAKSTQKKDKQLKYILNKNKSSFIMKSIIAIGAAILSLIINLFPTYSYEFAQFKPMFCTCVSIIALILEIVFSISAYSIVDVEEFNTKETNAFKVYIIKVLKITIFICVFSLLTILDERFYMGFIAMGIYLVIAYYISFIINLFIDWKVKTKNLIMLSDKEKKKNSAYKKVTIIAFIIIFLALILIGVMAMMG